MVGFIQVACVGDDNLEHEWEHVLQVYQGDCGILLREQEKSVQYKIHIKSPTKDSVPFLFYLQLS